MSLSTKTKFLVSTVVALGLAGAASATDRTFDGGSGGTGTDWNVAANWSGDTLPGNGDKAIIPSGFTTHVTANHTIDNFEIQSGGVVIVDAGVVLEIDMNSSVATSQGLRLAGSVSELKVSATLSISGAGSIEGQNNGALIRVPSGVTLTSTTKIEGALQIMDAGTFLNQGTVEANANGTLKVNPGTLDDNGSAVWRASTNGNAVLLFSEGGSLEGDFFQLAGKTSIEAVVTTTGDLAHSGGRLNLEQNFTVADYDWDGGDGRLAPSSSLKLQFATYSGSKTNPDNTPDLDPPYEIVNTDPDNELIWS